MKHTPGPWEPRHNAEDDRWYVGCGIIEIVHEAFNSEESSPNKGREIREANARLIATSPELLDALKQSSRHDKTDGKLHSFACRIMIDGMCNRPECAVIDAAIAKAEGRA